MFAELQEVATCGKRDKKIKKEERYRNSLLEILRIDQWKPFTLSLISSGTICRVPTISGQ